jgi:hypothetical protein
MTTLVDILVLWVPLVVTGLVIALNLIAPLTKTEVDNKILAGLRWFQDKALALLLPAHKTALRVKLSKVKLPKGMNADSFVEELYRYIDKHVNKTEGPKPVPPEE